MDDNSSIQKQIYRQEKKNPKPYPDKSGKGHSQASKQPRYHTEEKDADDRIKIGIYPIKPTEQISADPIIPMYIISPVACNGKDMQFNRISMKNGTVKTRKVAKKEAASLLH